MSKKKRTITILSILLVCSLNGSIVGVKSVEIPVPGFSVVDWVFSGDSYNYTFFND